MEREASQDAVAGLPTKDVNESALRQKGNANRDRESYGFKGCLVVE